MFIDFEAHRPVWATAREKCRACGAECIRVVNLESDLDRLKCAKCGLMMSAVTHFDAKPDDLDYCWFPRLELAQ